MAAYWPTAPDTNPIAAHLNATPKYVVTATLASLEWAGSHLLGGDVGASVNDLKQHGDGTIAVLGSGVLVQTLIAHDIIDEYRLFVHPLVLGTGKRLFRQTPRPIPLASGGWLAQAALAGLLALLPPLGPLLAVVFLLALADMPLTAAVGRCIPAVVADDDLVVANALRSGVWELGTVLGPRVAGLLFAAASG